MLLFRVKQIHEKRCFEIYKAHYGKPESHRDNLRHHRPAHNALISSSGLLAHILLKRRLIAKHDCAKTVHYEVDE